MSLSSEIGVIFRKIINLRDSTDVRGTIEGIRSGINIQGYNIWILACAAIIASIGLDQDSPAVIIGAMLISPLMSPILGIGLSIGINDRKHLILALENFTIAMLASLVMSTLYFLITPLGKMNPSIASRTEPTLLDVLIAFTGGIAGIVAGSRKDKTNAIPGVAIATALMPPVCVAGYGLANANWPVFLGAIYLFFINSVFISLATYLMVRFLRFPFTEYQDADSKQKAFRWVLVFAFVVTIPSGIIFFNVIQRFQLSGQAETFIEEEVNNDNHQALGYRLIDKDTVTRFNIFMTGASLSDDSVAYLNQRLKAYGMEEVDLHFVQNLPDVSESDILTQARTELLSELLPQIEQQRSRMDSLRMRLVAFKEDSVLIDQLEGEMYSLYPGLRKFTYASVSVTCEQGTERDTLPAVLVNWKRGLRSSAIRQQEGQLKAWLPVRLGVDSCVVVRVE